MTNRSQLDFNINEIIVTMLNPRSNNRNGLPFYYLFGVSREIHYDNEMEFGILHVALQYVFATRNLFDFSEKSKGVFHFNIFL